MCLILRGTAANILRLDIEYAEMYNPDGWGISDTLNRRTFSFNTDRTLRETLDQASQQEVFTVHFRMATHGVIDIGNAHPFDIGNDLLLFHNGVARNFTQGPRRCSDTANLANFLRNKPWRVIHKTLSSETTSRFMVTRGESVRKFGKWIKVDGVLASNGQIHSMTPWSDSYAKAYVPFGRQWRF